MLTPWTLLCGLAATLALGVCVWVSTGVRGHSGLNNDFYIYWAGARLLAHHRTPYDIAAIRKVVEGAHQQVLYGLGYTYPLLFCILLVPLGLLPAPLAAAVFSGLSLVAFALAVAVLTGLLRGLQRWEQALFAIVAGTFIPATGSFYFGQANLIVLLLLSLAMAGSARGFWLALSSAIKLYPLAGLGALLPPGGRNWRQLAIGLAATFVLGALPNLLLNQGTHDLARMFTPDAFWTNHSVDGALSRLVAFGPSALRHVPETPTMFAIAAAIGLAGLVVVLAVGGRPWDGSMALLMTCAVMVAPRDSLWNFAPLLLALVWCLPRVRRRPLPLLVLVIGWGLIELQGWVDIDLRPHLPLATPLALLSSLALLGALLVAGLQAYLMLSAAERSRAEVRALSADGA